MAIVKMNSFFARHHRIVFGVFTVIIIIAFTDFLTPGTGIVDALRGNGRGSSAGEVFGRKVGYRELEEQMRKDMLIGQAFLGMNYTGAMSEQLENQAFYSLAAQEAAKQAGIQVTDEEVGRFLSNFFRNEKGEFNQEVYRNFIDGFLTRQGYSESDLNEATRSYLTMAKMQAAQQEALTVTEGERKSFYNWLNAEYDVLQAEFKAADFTKDLKIDPAELDKFFQANRKNYIIPANMQGLVLEYPYAQYQKEAEKSLTEADLKAFYENNKQLFSKVEKDSVVVQEYDKVKSAVRTEAAAAKARDLAMYQAQQFGTAAYEEIGNAPAEKRLEIFRKLVSDAKLKAIATGRFNSDSKTAGVIDEPALVSEFASVFTDVPVTNAIPGKKAAYLGYVTEFVPSREAELNEVEAAVKADFTRVRSVEAARTRAAEVAANLKTLPEAGRVERAKAMKTPGFKALNKLTAAQGFATLGNAVSAISVLLPNEVSEAIPMADGAQVLILVNRALPAKAYEASPEQDAMLDNMIKSYKVSMHQAAFQNYLSEHCVRYGQPAEATPQAE